ncbi:putative aldehyde reductase i [Cutaneotrichosporon oleaginosum]|uniref:Putative aldehyde reductase i n=1 Tax=Cutaneotrichosporon oleaginosum TaxID=879819 RepID=A0A0J1AZ86_9TREE|nr:putative aldehyde reductase i [Cutaneotrichosporon oleaginosum]KLT40654.1 putative aldehyde reductase i [Cutaneotrichosporon oleaginosum]TXT12464.1 hypothetical protein COLE_02874 [Cutaneotrichosporon oleaginosum]
MPTTEFTLSDGRKLPAIGLGTWQSPKGEVAKAVEHALKNGYKHIDCAWAYGNEAEVGEGIKKAGLPRDQFWITSKLFELHHHPEHVSLAIKDTLKNLGLEYLDLYLLHWNINWQVDAPEGVLPTREHTVKSEKSGKVLLDVELSDDIMPTWREMEKLVDQGLVKSIGVSNLNIHRVKKLLKEARIKPVTNQVELSIQCPQFELVDWLHKQNIQPQGYSPLGGAGGSALRENPEIKKIADKHNVGVTTIMLSWLVKRGINPLPKSCTPERIDQNLKIIDLTDDEFEAVNKIARSVPHKRVCDQSHDFEPYYDIYQENDPEYNDKVQAQKP